MNVEALGYPMHERETQTSRFIFGYRKRTYVNLTHGYGYPCMTKGGPLPPHVVYIYRSPPLLYMFYLSLQTR